MFGRKGELMFTSTVSSNGASIFFLKVPIYYLEMFLKDYFSNSGKYNFLLDQ